MAMWYSTFKNYNQRRNLQTGKQELPCNPTSMDVLSLVKVLRKQAHVSPCQSLLLLRQIVDLLAAACLHQSIKLVVFPVWQARLQSILIEVHIAKTSSHPIPALTSPRYYHSQHPEVCYAFPSISFILGNCSERSQQWISDSQPTSFTIYFK